MRIKSRERALRKASFVQPGTELHSDGAAPNKTGLSHTGKGGVLAVWVACRKKHQPVAIGDNIA